MTDSISGLRILVVEDSQLYQDLFAKTLGKEGHQCDAALDGESALEMVRTGNYDMAFLDVNLPGKSGFEIHPILEDLSPGLKVVFITGNSSPEVLERMKTVDAFGYIIKPFELDEIRDAVRRCAGGSSTETTQQTGQTDGITDHTTGKVPAMTAEESLDEVECEECHLLFRLGSWNPGTECPGCGRKTTVPAAFPDDVGSHQPEQTGESPLRALRFGRVARWGQLITVGQLVECLVLQWKAKRSGGPTSRLGEMMVEKGYLTPRQVNATLKMQTSRNNVGEQNRFGRIAIQNEFINGEQFGRCIATQEKLAMYGGPPPRLEHIVMEKGYMLESQVRAVLKVQARKFHEGLLESLQRQSMSPARRAMTRWSYVRQEHPRLHDFGVTALLVILIASSFMIFRKMQLLEHRIGVIDESGELHQVSSRNMASRSRKLGKKLYFALYCKRCAVHFPLNVVGRQGMKTLLKPCPKCGKLDETDIPESVVKPGANSPSDKG